MNGVERQGVYAELSYLFLCAQCEINEDTFDDQDFYYCEIL
jgi:hypothetical protein